MPTQIAEPIGIIEPPFRPAVAVTARGHELEFPDISYILQDLFEYGYITPQEFYMQRYWVNLYRIGSAMPGTTSFRCVYTGELVTFPWWLEGLYAMWNLASHWFDLQDQEEDIAHVFSDDEGDDLGTLAGMIIEIRPINIGRFNMNPFAMGRPLPEDINEQPTYTEFHEILI